MLDTVVLDGDCKLILPENGDASLTTIIDGESSIVTYVRAADYYDGPTEITPSSETQILQTLGLLIPANITINPIPNNYGLITWNGSTLTVS